MSLESINHHLFGPHKKHQTQVSIQKSSTILLYVRFLAFCLSPLQDHSSNSMRVLASIVSSVMLLPRIPFGDSAKKHTKKIMRNKGVKGLAESNVFCLHLDDEFIQCVEQGFVLG